MTADRRADITVRPNQALWNEQVFRDYTGALDRRASRTHIERLSLTNPVIAAGSKGRETVMRKEGLG